MILVYHDNSSPQQFLPKEDSSKSDELRQLLLQLSRGSQSDAMIRLATISEFTSQYNCVMIRLATMSEFTYH